MFNPHIMSPQTIDWLAQHALNELHGSLGDRDNNRDKGSKWADMARSNAAQCRAVALAAGNEVEMSAWLCLATQYEAIIQSEDLTTSSRSL